MSRSDDFIGAAPLDRRSLLLGAGALPLAATLSAATRPGTFETRPLWPHQPPGSAGVIAVQERVDRKPATADGNYIVEHVTSPTLTVLRPERPNGAALLIIPGGGYRYVSMGNEGFPVARRFAAAGYTCFILLYRLPADHWGAGPDAPLQDAQRAVRTIRAQARDYDVDPERIGVVGFSAGGHLAGWLSTRDEPVRGDPVDAIDGASARVTAAAMIYPVVTLIDPLAHAGSRIELLGATADPVTIARYSLQNGMMGSPPPVQLIHALDDPAVPYQNSLIMAAAVRAHHAPVEVHLLESGGHGFGLGVGRPAAAMWPGLTTAFLARHGL